MSTRSSFGGEYSRTGEVVDDRGRAAMPDEAPTVLTAAWSGEPVRHAGAHYRVDDIAFDRDAAERLALARHERPACRRRSVTNRQSGRRAPSVTTSGP